jgi:hypothetical protein
VLSGRTKGGGFLTRFVESSVHVITGIENASNAPSTMSVAVTTPPGSEYAVTESIERSPELIKSPSITGVPMDPMLGPKHTPYPAGQLVTADAVPVKVINAPTTHKPLRNLMLSTF